MTVPLAMIPPPVAPDVPMDFVAFAADGRASVYIEGVDFRALRSKAAEDSFALDEAYEDEWEEVESSDVDDEEAAPVAAPSASDVAQQLLVLVQDLCDTSLSLTSNYMEEGGLDSISIALLLSKVQGQFAVALTAADVAPFETVQGLAEEIARRVPASAPPRPRAARRKAVRRRRRARQPRQEEWEEVEVSEEEEEEGVLAGAPSPADVAEQLLGLVNDLSGVPLQPSSRLVEDAGLDSISLSLMASKIQQQFGVALTMADMSTSETVHALTDDILRRMPARQPQPQAAKRRRKVVRRLKVPAGGAADADGLAIDVGANVRVAGLVARAELNGMTGVLVAYHCAAECWQLRPHDGSTCKLVREANLEVIDLERAQPGVRVLHAVAGEPHIYIVHSLGEDIVDEELLEEMKQRSAGHLCALEYDDEAQACESVPALADLYSQRVLREARSKGGLACGPITLAGSSFGCEIAHCMAVQLSMAGVSVALALFGSGLARPPAAGGEDDREWLGGAIESALLLARILGARAWAMAEAARLRRLGARALDAEDVAMRVYWEHARHTGIDVHAFRGVVEALGRKYDRLHGLKPGPQPLPLFTGPVDLVLSPGEGQAAAMELHAARCDRRAARRA